MSEAQETPPPVRQAELVRDLALKLAADQKTEWSQIRMHVRAVAGYQESETWVSTPNGETTKVYSPVGIGGMLNSLREAMYRPGKGAWFSADFVVDRSGSVDTTFDFDYEPKWDLILPEQYRNDQERYPRDEEHTPEWLKSRLAEAAGG